MEEKAPLTLVEKRDMDPPTRLKLKWEQVQQQATSTDVEKDKSQADMMAEAEAAGMTQRDIAECLGISQMHVQCLLRYYRFNTFYASLKAAAFKIPEFRFRQYWKDTIDPQSMRGRRTQEYRDTYERRVFLAIIEKLEAGKPPGKPMKAKKPPTVAQMHAKQNPLTALRKEVKRLYSAECKPILAQLKDFLGRDRATFAPSLMAACAMDLEKWAKKLETVLQDFDTYVHDETPEADHCGETPAYRAGKACDEFSFSQQRDFDPEKSGRGHRPGHQAPGDGRHRERTRDSEPPQGTH